MSSTKFGLRDRQQYFIKRFLCSRSADRPDSIETHSTDFWRVMIYDEMGQSIISPILSVKHLRQLGITMHMSLNSKRERIEEAPAVYFIFPSSANIDLLCEDIKSDLYQSYYVNFITHIPRDLLEKLAECVVVSGANKLVKKVYDQYVNFICLESDLFVLSNCDDKSPQSISYYSINRPNIQSESEMMTMVNVIVDGLFSVLLTMDSIPFITYPQGGMAEAVGQALDKKLRSALNDTNNNFFSGSEVGLAMGQLSFNRPILILVDRDFDMATPLQHVWSYQALIHDLMGTRLNKLTISTGQSSPQTYILGENGDTFWNDHMSSSFPQVAEDIQHELDDYRVSEQEVKRLKTVLGLSDADDVSSVVSDTTTKLNSAVSSLPQLMERKKFLDMHTNIATCLLDRIKSRQIDVFFEYEQRIVSKQDLGRPIIDVLQDDKEGQPRDKLRLYLVYLIFTESELSKADLAKCEKALLSAGCSREEVRAINYIQRWRLLNRRMNVNAGSAISAQTNMFSDLLTKASRFAMEGVRNFNIKQKQRLPLTRLVECLMDSHKSACPGSEKFVFLDPKRVSNVERSRLKHNAFTRAVVFMVGGGSYVEYSNLLECLSNDNRHVTYGCTELLSADGFLDQTDLSRSLDLKATMDEARRYYDTYEKDSGKIEFDDFVKIVGGHSRLEDPETEIMEAFKTFDTEQTGRIAESDLKHILTKTGERLSQRDVDRLLSNCRVGRDGKFVYKDLVKTMLRNLNI